MMSVLFSVFYVFLVSCFMFFTFLFYCHPYYYYCLGLLLSVLSVNMLFFLRFLVEAKEI